MSARFEQESRYDRMSSAQLSLEVDKMLAEYREDARTQDPYETEWVSPIKIIIVPSKRFPPPPLDSKPH